MSQLSCGGRRSAKKKKKKNAGAIEITSDASPQMMDSACVTVQQIVATQRM